MQTMPSKNRSVVLGVAALAAVVLMGVLAMRAGKGELPVADAETPIVGEEAIAGTPLDAAPLTAETVTEIESPDPLIAEETDPVATPVMASVPDMHVVKEGESLSGIAKYYYGNAAYAGDIEAMNDLDDPDRLEVGQALMLPRPESLPALAN